MNGKLNPIKFGPDKWTIISSFADRRIVEFKTEYGAIKGILDIIQHEDESGNSFIFTLIEKKGSYSGSYNPKTKKGHIRKIL